MLRHQQDDVECDASIFKARKKTNIKGRGVSQSPRLMACFKTLLFAMPLFSFAFQ